jgi:hypothetical protein
MFETPDLIGKCRFDVFLCFIDYSHLLPTEPSALSVPVSFSA